MRKCIKTQAKFRQNFKNIYKIYENKGQNERNISFFFWGGSDLAIIEDIQEKISITQGKNSIVWAHEKEISKWG